MKSIFWLVVFVLFVTLGSQLLNTVMTALTAGGAHILR